ncbi:class A beta-lactamase [Streptomyces sp. SCUT-3]|uniref:class A beta-lactamase n=1 Tax=Streptomyces TaxID=1883 RepID=UPI0015FB5DC9|nr:class A beta-lactamase [Streptomyces sp. SCUT-3]QMV24487.1 class A beta-lactamase [Streptomyces sp. SCUT-3]
MTSRGSARPTRRTLLSAGAATALTGALVAAGTAAGTPSHAVPAGGGPGERGGSRGHDGRTAAQLRRLEARHRARIGAFAHNLATGATVLHRAHDRFPLCSVFKPLAAAAVLRDLDRDGEVLAERIRYTEADVVADSPVTGTDEHLATGMTVGELCDAAVRHSDNTAGNLLLRRLGGPSAVTRFCRSTGDTVTRLDRWEPELNSAEPWRVEDTTTPYAIARTYARLVVGDVLEPRDRERLTHWLLTNTTNEARFRAGLPEDWSVADKTGAGEYGTCNDVGVARTPEGVPVVLAVLTRKGEADAKPDNPLVAETAALLAAAVA